MEGEGGKGTLAGISGIFRRGCGGDTWNKEFHISPINEKKLTSPRSVSDMELMLASPPLSEAAGGGGGGGG